MPPWLAFALVAQVIRRVGAHGVVGARVRGARREDLGASGPAVRKLTQACETGHAVHTGALVQTGAGGTLVDVHLAEVTSEALATFAGEAIELVDACPGILTGTR